MISQSKIPIRRDPFYVEPLPKAHYVPTEKKNLSETQKQTALSPNRKVGDHDLQNDETRLSYNDQLFLKGGNLYSSNTNQDGDESGSSKFDESWPSTDRPSSLNEGDHPLNEYIYRQNQDRLRDLKKTLEFPERDEERKGKKNLMSQNGNMRQDSSTLQRYIERFRSGQPMSREERQKATSSSKKDFWWLSDRSMTESSTPKDHSPGVKRTKRFTPHSPISPYKSHDDKKSHLPPSSPGLDQTTKLLQDKADRLLDSASSVASSDPIVSTDGLGSSLSFNSTVSTLDEKPFRLSFARKWERQDRPSYQIPKPQGRQPTGPEDDVLYQWRLKRRMEQARDSAAKGPAVKFGYKDKVMGQKDLKDQKLEEFKQKLSGRSVEPTALNISDTSEAQIHHGRVQFTPAPNSQSTRTQKAFPVASPSLPKSGADQIEPHFHLTCDLLPCDHQGLYKHEKKEQKSDKSEQEVGSSEKHNIYSDDEETVCYKKGMIEHDRYKFLEAEKPHVEEKVKVENEIKPADVINKYKSVESDDNESCISDHSVKSNKFHESGKRVKNRDIETSKKKNNDLDSNVPKDKDSSQSRTRQRDLSPRTLDKGDSRKDKSIPEIKPSGKPSHSKPLVESAIGQVVQDRLFNISNSTVISSIDSDASSPVQRPKVSRRPQEKTKSSDLSYDSDGEYPDDQLLHMLRQQRAQYEDQLRHIDELLSKLDSDDS